MLITRRGMAERRRTFNLQGLAVGDLVEKRSLPLLWAPSGQPRQEPPICPSVVSSRGDLATFFCSQQSQRTPEATAAADEDRSRSDTLCDDSSYFSHASQLNQWITEDTEELCSESLPYNSSFSSDKKIKKGGVWNKLQKN